MSLRFTDLSGFGENFTDLRSNLVLKLRSQVLKYLAPQALKAVHCETIGIFRSSVHVNILILSTQILGSLLSPHQDCFRLSSAISECFLYPLLEKNGRHLGVLFYVNNFNFYEENYR